MKIFKELFCFKEVVVQYMHFYAMFSKGGFDGLKTFRISSLIPVIPENDFLFSYSSLNSNFLVVSCKS